MKITIIFNPIAGRRNPVSLARAVQAFKAYDIDPVVKKTEKRGDAYHIALEAAQKGTETIIAAGGDGTINEIANALVGSSSKLGILPMGVANLFALEMQIPHDPTAAVDIIVHGSPQQISPGYIQLQKEGGTGEILNHFLLMAGIGFDGGVLREIKRAHIARWGKAAYVITGARFLSKYTHSQLTIRIDQKETLTASSAVVGKSRYYGGKFMVTPRASLKDDCLDLCVFKNKGTLSMIKYACGVLTGNHLRHTGIYYAKAHELEMSSSEEIYVQADGDFLGRLPARLGVTRDALSVMVPGI